MIGLNFHSGEENHEEENLKSFLLNFPQRLNFVSVLNQYTANDVSHADWLALFVGDIFRMVFEP